MGLFDGGSVKEAAEAEVMQALSKHPMLSKIMEIFNGELSWATQCADYYDDRERVVMFGKDSFCIRMRKNDVKVNVASGAVKVTSEENEFTFFTYTQFGYKPLHTHTATNGKTISSERVVYLWATVVLEALMSAYPNGEYGSVFPNESGSVFSYKVPPLTLDDWF